MLKTAALVLLSIPLLLVGLLASSSCLVVDVKQVDGPRIIVPVPMVLARAAVGFLPREATHVHVPELAEYGDLARKIIDELRNAPDGVLVEVDDRNDHVLVEKIDDEIAIEVLSDEEEVSLRIPLGVVTEIFESYDDGELEVANVVRALAGAGRSELVHVRTADEEVKIRIW